MGIIFKFLITNLKEKKLRTALIVFAITIASALCFASFGISDSFRNIVIEKYKISFGSSDLVITAKENSKSPFVDVDDISSKISGDIGVGIFNASGIYKKGDNKYHVNILGSDVSKIDKINKMELEKSSKKVSLNSLAEDEVIISKVAADKLGVKLGDRLKFKVDGKDMDFKVGALVVPKGFFTEEPSSFTVLVNNKALAKALDIEESYTTEFIKVEDGKDVDSLKEKLSFEFKDYNVRKAIEEKDLEDAVSQYTVPFYIMLVVVLLMAFFIIYSSFKIIVLERMSVIGTFRSIGATKLSTDFVLLTESLLYGVIGGILGDLVGIPVLYLLSDMSNQYKSLGVKTMVNISPKNLLLAFIIALVISIVSSVIPILSIIKIPVKDIILGTFKKVEKRSYVRLTLGLLLFIAPFIFIKVYKASGIFIATAIAPFMVFIGGAMLLPYIILLLALILKEVYRKILGNEGAIALDNLANSKNLIHNVVLLALGLGAVIIVGSAAFSVEKLVAYAFKDMNYEVSLSNINNRNGQMVLDKLKTLKEVDSYYQDFNSRNIEVKDKEFKLGYFQGVDIDKYKNFFTSTKFFNDKEEIDDEKALKSLESGRTILITDIIKDKYKIKVGDKLSIKFNEDYHEYEVVGFLSSEMSSNNRNCLISEENYKKDMNQSYPSTILIKGNMEASKLGDKLKDELEDLGAVVKLKDEEERVNISRNADLMNMLQGFSVMALVIGAFGMVNNLMVSFIERKRELAVLASIGMSKRKRGKMLLIEGVTTGIIGSVAGVFLGLSLIDFIPEITLALNTYLKIRTPYGRVVFLGIFGVVLVLIASIAPILKSSKISIINEIKYE